MQDVCGPLPELDSTARLDAITYRNDDIETVECRGPVCSSNVQKVHVSTFYQLFLVKDVSYVAANHADVSTEESGHSICAEPYLLVGGIYLDR
jgi:hypothetical protein